MLSQALVLASRYLPYVGMNVIGNIQPCTDATTLVPTVKWKFYENEKKNTALIAGTTLPFVLPVWRELDRQPSPAADPTPAPDVTAVPSR